MPRPRAAIYCRLSLAHDEAGVARQEVDCRKLAEARRWNVVAVHIDNSRSAWQRNRKRPGWDALLAGIRDGHYDAVVVYHGDRLIRQSIDLEHLLRLSEDKGIRLASILGDRDLDNHDDRYILRIEAAGHTRESDSTSRRMKRALADKAAAGMPHATGRRPFGYERDGITVRQDEADVFTELVARVLAGESTGSLVRDLNARGLVTTAGKEWTHGTVRKMLARPRYAGLRSHHDDALVPAVWPELIDRATWESVSARLTAKAGDYDYTTNARRYLLTGIALCGSCRQPLVVRQNRLGIDPGYACMNRECRARVHRAQPKVDEHVIDRVLARLSDPRVARGLRSPRPKGAGVGAEITALESRRRAIVRDFARSKVLTTTDLEAAVGEIDERLEQLRSTLADTSRGRVLAGLAGLDEDGWKDLGLDRQRAVVSALVEVKVQRGRMGPGFDPSTVTVTPRR